MRRTPIAAMGLVALLGTASPAAAEPPRVVTDIAAIESLVVQVMSGVGEPVRVMDHGASPHEYQLRPSEAQALERAEIVMFVSGGLTPWLEEAVDALAPDARHIELMELEGVTRLENRETALFEFVPEEGGHDDADHEGSHDEHAEHDDHDEHEEHSEHEDHAEHEEHEEGHGHDHDHGAYDPHGWLLPENAIIWLDAIGVALAEADPKNATLYAANVKAAQVRVRDASEQLSREMAAHAQARFVVFHDAYQYFEDATGVRAAGAIALSDARAPGAARVAAIRDAVRENDIACVFAEPQFNQDLALTVIEGSGARLASLDPLGSALEPGEGFYVAFLRNLAADMTACFEGG